MSDNVGYDKQDPNPWAVGIGVFSVIIFTFAAGFGLEAYFGQFQREVYERNVMQSPNEQLNKLRADSAAGLKKVDQAMALALADIKAAAAQPASAPAKAPAPAPKKK